MIKIHEALMNVWTNIFRAEEALNQYKTIADFANELNKTQDAHFWGITQQHALESFVIHICKIYDESNKRYLKHTVPSLIGAMKQDDFKISPNIYFNLTDSDLEILGIRKELVNNSDRDVNHIVTTLKAKCPNQKETEALRKILTYRNKQLAHQEQLECESKPSELSSLENMEYLSRWGKIFCEFIDNLYPHPESLPTYLNYAGCHTKKVIEYIISKNNQ